MPREAIIDLPCSVKHRLAADDLRAGSRKLINLLRAQDRVEQMRARPRQDGRAIDEVPVRVLEITPEGIAERTATVGELDAETRELDPLVPICTNCPANALRRPFGCVGGLPYPIKPAVERYALDRAAPPDRLGGKLLLESLEQFEVTGEIARGFRADARFEAMSAPSRKLPDNPFGKATLSSDELFEPFLIDHGPMPQWLALNVLLWFEAILLEGRLPQTINDALALSRMPPEDRSHRTRINLGPPAFDQDAEPFRGLLKLIYIGWCFDNEVMIDS